ncbi:exodeoxyribonuclease VII large subunit [candidate division KSB1 bacterium]|nr:exodeoxyribonuclease VII large subunit [candidate division KSB1 bacterium]
MFDFESPDVKILTITELTREIKLLIESSFPMVWAEGEISNFKLHSSGHMYFSLKDSGAQVSCVLWRTRAQSLRFTPQDGMKVIVMGAVTLYEKRGAYQLDIAKMQPSGIGDLQLAFEQLKQKLKEEGLFDQQYKKPIPKFPERIGIVTSPTGAAIRDLLNVLTRRFPCAEVIINPVRVQGDGAAQEIARAIDEFNEYGQIDVMIVGRGGGSLEDLWAFNEEVTARAIFRSKIPVISAVGHEIDFSISDFVADLRAPTPSAAAELVVPDKDDLMHRIVNNLRTMHDTIATRIQYYQDRLVTFERSYGIRRPTDLVKQFQQRLDDVLISMQRIQSHRLDMLRSKLESTKQRLTSLAPMAVLKRGYSICYREQDDQIISNASDLEADDKIRVQFNIGHITGTVEEVNANNMEQNDDPEKI